ncbi:hypothetical protein R1flu_020737 [Riccia fluitans]|uniref:Uncharacterized protein n=1 Tax=Riccia fluitans TaxID=41844 RepID=A0ABD1ZR21_9MARC
MTQNTATVVSEVQTMSKLNAAARLEASRDESKPTQKKQGPKRSFDVSLIVGIVRADIQMQVFELLTAYIEKEAYLGMVSLERGDANLQLHTQGVLTFTTSSTKALKSDILEATGWEETAPPGS